MNREIKFRVWGIKNNKFLDLSEQQYCFIQDKDELILMGSGGWQLSNIVIEQYIGLKDKNNKDIFIGDILKVNTGSKEAGTEWYLDNCRVKYREDIAGYSLCGTHEDSQFRFDMHLLDEEDKEFTNGRTHSIASWRLEILGNIHENPSLIPTLEQVKEQWKKDKMEFIPNVDKRTVSQKIKDYFTNF